MLENIKKISYYLITFAMIFIAGYFYIYKGFIDVDKNSINIEYKEIVKNNIIEEKKILLSEVFYKYKSDNQSYIANLIDKFISYKENKSFHLKLYFQDNISIKKFNDFFGEDIFIDTDKGIKVENMFDLYIENIHNDILQFKLTWYINNKEIYFEWFIDKNEKYIIFSFIKIQGVLSLINDPWIESFLLDGFNIKYGALVNKKIKLTDNQLNIIDWMIAERKIIDFNSIFKWIDTFFKFNNDITELNYKIDTSNQELLPNIDILKSNTLSIWEKQKLLLKINELLFLLNNTQLFLTKEKLVIENTNSNLIFDFKLEIINKDTDYTIKNFAALNKSNDIIDFKELLNDFYSQNKILLKYMNNKDFLFLIE